MKMSVSILLFAIIFGISLLHFYWGSGRKKWFSASFPSREDGKPVFKPKIVDCFTVGTGLLLIGIFILLKGGWLDFTIVSWLCTYGLSVIAFVFAVRAVGDFRYVGFFKSVKNTTFGRMDTRYYSPLCVIIAALCLILEYV